MSRLVPEPTRQAAPAPHFPQTEFLPGPIIHASCACGWRAIASSHEHSVQLGKEHVDERARAARQSAKAHEGRAARVDDLTASIERIAATGGYFPELDF